MRALLLPLKMSNVAPPGEWYRT